MQKDEKKTKAQLIQELREMRTRLAMEQQEIYGGTPLAASRHDVRRYLDLADVIIIVVNKDETIALINHKACDLLGYSEQELTGNNFFLKLIPARLRSGMRKQFKFLMSGKIELIQVQHENAILTSTGKEKIITWQTSILTDEMGYINGMIASGVDITERKRAEETLRAMLFIDELTGLYNRRGFQAMARQQISLSNRTKNEILLLFTDIDGMKEINDTFGHQIGDQALIDAANILRRTFRQSDIIARIGGDEFVVLTIGSKDTGAETILARLQQNQEEHNESKDRPYNLTMSTGIACYISQFPHSIDEFIAQADKMMYQKKRVQKNRKSRLCEVKWRIK